MDDKRALIEQIAQATVMVYNAIYEIALAIEAGREPSFLQYMNAGAFALSLETLNKILKEEYASTVVCDIPGEIRWAMSVIADEAGEADAVAGFFNSFDEAINQLEAEEMVNSAFGEESNDMRRLSFGTDGKLRGME